jgi:1,4-dihydroxy-6-naphthoate synthase
MYKDFSLAFSPCPNDTFIFEALLHHKIDTSGYSFKEVYLDVQQLNSEALTKRFDITKLSYFAMSDLLESYQILSSGSALGFGCGPLLIANKNIPLDQVEKLRIAIPGKNTTAFFLLKQAFPNVENWVEMLFSDIENAVHDEDVDLGLIIHENRFTYEGKGLKKIIDLGEYWEKTTGHPIPLGCIAVRRDFPFEIKNQINQLIKNSILYAKLHPLQNVDYIKIHSQEMDDHVIQSHIDLYVNDYSIDLGDSGKNAILYMFSKIGLQEDLLNSSYVFV